MSRAPADLDLYWDRLQAGAQALRFEMPDHEAFPHTQGGFDAFRKACGVKYFSAREACTPRWKAKAKSVGYERFVPPQFVWPWCALVLKLCDGMRRAIEEPIKLRNLWRPQSYNRLVAGSGIESDHPNGCGADLYFSGVGSRRKAEGFLRGVHAVAPELEMSLGLGARVVHVGVLSVKGGRTWFYETFTDARSSLA